MLTMLTILIVVMFAACSSTSQTPTSHDNYQDYSPALDKHRQTACAFIGAFGIVLLLILANMSLPYAGVCLALSIVASIIGRKRAKSRDLID